MKENSTKEKLLTWLEENRDVYFSGEDLATALDISRTAVWKAIKTLQAEGYPIDAITNKGYRLAAHADILSVQGIRKYLRRELQDAPICLLPQTTSTNTVLREKAAELPQWSVVLSGLQTAGRGRRGRIFYSPPGTGIYMSVLLRPSACEATETVHITTMAAVAVCEAVEETAGVDAQIKWVNDVFVRGNKVCGILTDGAFGMESGLLEYAVLGMGINVYEPEGGFPEELRSVAGAVFDAPASDVKNKLAATVLNKLYTIYTEQNKQYAEAYRKRSMAVGKQIMVLREKESKCAVALAIDEECRLRVRYEDGTEETLQAGEISIRL